MKRYQIIQLCLFIVLLLCNISKADERDLVERARSLHSRILTIDTHCDTPLHMKDSTFDVGVRHITGSKGSGKVDLPRMQGGNLDAEFFAVFTAQKERNAENYQAAQQAADALIASIKAMCQKYSSMIALATTPDDAYKNQKLGLPSAYIGMENGFPLAKEIKNLDKYYQMGVRYLTLCHTANNDICDSSTDPKGPEHKGLSDFGRQVVERMNRLGIIVDVSHISDKAFYDVLQISKAPVIASHSCARALCDNPRNMKDEMLKALAAKDGVIQICFMSEYLKAIEPNPEQEAAFSALRKKYGPLEEITDPQIRRQYRTEYYEIKDRYPRKRATVQDVVDHIEHVIKIAGVDHVGIGTDFDGGGNISGCADVSEMPNITIELVKRGHSEEEIRKIWSGNFMRVFQGVIEVSRKLEIEH